MSREEMQKKIIDTIMEVGDLGEVHPEDSFMDDLEMSSVEIMELLAELETVLNIRIPERILSRVATVEDMCNEVAEIMKD